MKRIIVILHLLILAGCHTTQPIVDIAPLSTQIDKLSTVNSELTVANERLKAANDALTAENARLLSMIRADADAGQSANLKGWLPFEKYVWGHQIALLPDIVPDKTTADRWSEASTLYAAGGESAMQGVINTLNADAKKTNETLGTLREQVADLAKERDAANEAATAALERVHKAEAALASAVEQAVQNENKRVMAEVRASQVEFWNRCGYGLGIAALGLAAGAFFSPMAKKKLAEGSVLSAVLSAASFASARFFASKWFVWVMGIAGAVAGGALLFHKLKTSHEASETAKKKLVYQKFGEAVVPVMDDAYDNASAEDKAILDAKIFDQLSAVEDAQVKALVDEIRASIKLANVDK
jgi:hypothetical protein